MILIEILLGVFIIIFILWFWEYKKSKHLNMVKKEMLEIRDKWIDLQDVARLIK